MTELRRLGPRLHLDEPTLNHEWVRFDAPGDFQLCLRDDYIAVDGCDEAMLLGWHVDSNLSRRLLLRRGSIESLETAFAGYHCNHSRTPTVYHGPERIANDLTRFFLNVERADLPEQRDTWGLVGATLEEVAVGPATGVRFTDALVAAIPPAAHGRSPSSLVDAAFALAYDSAHVLPHVADSIAVSGRQTTIGYLGANRVLRDMIDRFVAELSGDGSLTSLYASEVGELEELAESADLFIVDLGVDASVEPALAPRPAGVDVGLSEFPETLRPVAIAFESLVRRERARLERGMHPRRFVLINSTTAYLDSFVVTNLDCSGTTTHSRVRRATVKLVPTLKVSPLRDVRWADRLKGPREPLQLRIGKTAEFGNLESFEGFGPGWWLPDPSGVWTRGPRAVLAMALGNAPTWARPVLQLTFDRVGVRRGRRVRISLVIDDRLVETKVLTGGTRLRTWRVRVPPHALEKGSFDVALEIEGRSEWSDSNQLGIHLRSIRVDSGMVPIPLRDWFDHAEVVCRRLVRRVRHGTAQTTARLSGLPLRRGGASGH